MKPISFPEQNTVWAKDQPEYQPLPAYVDSKQSISCWQLTWRERLWVFCTGKLWLLQMNFQQSLQPQLPMVERPFVTEKVK